MGRMQITPDDFKRAKLVKPGWYCTLVKVVVEELNSKKDAMNQVLDLECAERESDFFGVPCKHWLSEKGISMPGGGVAFFKAFNPKSDESKMADFDPVDYQGRYIYAKWNTNRGKDGTEPPKNVIEDWAPLPAKYADLANVNVNEVAAVSGVSTFGQ